MRVFPLHTAAPLPPAYHYDEAGQMLWTCVRCGVRNTARKPKPGTRYMCLDCRSVDPYYYRQVCR